MQEQLISFEISKLAKQKGFNHIKANCYGDNMCYQLPNGELINALRGNTVTGYILAPTQSLLQKWLREKHELNVIVNLTHGSKFVHYYSVIYDCNVHRPKEVNLYDINNYIKTYEQALEKGLQEALKLIKK